MILTKRTNSLDFLHPLVRTAATTIIEELAAEGVDFKIFETYRTPERQKFLRAKSPKVTNAGPWQSMHQYGLAVDFVINVRGVNPWSTKGEHRQWWDMLHESGARNGLTPIRGELPHMQIRDWSWRAALRGNGYWPEGGDDPWVWNLHETALRYPAGAPERLPDYPEDVMECRPPLED